MARIHRVNKAQTSKRARRCGKCNVDIVPGMAYKWVKPSRYSGKMIRCAECPDWTTSEMDTSKMSTAYAGQEAAHEALNALTAPSYEDWFGVDGVWESLVSDVSSALEAAQEAAQEAAADYQDGLDNMPEGLQQGPTGELIQEKIDALESWESELDGWSPTSEEPDLDEFMQEPDEEETEDEGLDPDAEDTCTDPEGAQQAVEDWFEEVLSEARDAVDSLEV